MNKDSKIYVAGHTGMVGSALVRKLEKEGYNNIITRRSYDLNLTNQKDVRNFFEEEEPEYVFLAAATVGGILANTQFPAQFIYDNLMIQTNVIHQSHLNGVKKLLFLGSSCIYPKLATQPINEKELLNGYLEETNDAYAVAKIAGIKMCQSYNKQYETDFISVMPTNLYGINDNYEPNGSHVFASFIRKVHESKTQNKKFIEMWGTGTPMREFLDVEDVADACLFLMLNYNDSDIINVGSGEDITIKNLLEKMMEIIGYDGYIKLDKSKPDGTPRKLLDVSKINNLGWKHSINIEDGIRGAYKSYISTL